MHAVETFQAVIAEAGLGLPEIIADGSIHRFKTPIDKGGAKSGWFVFYSDGIPSGAFGSWKADEKHTWCSNDTNSMTPDERAEFSKRMRQAKRAREAERKRIQAEAASTCRELWSKASERIDHPYIKDRGIKPYGLRQLRNMLLVPMYLDDNLVNLQFIPAEPNPETGKRDKKFKRGGRKKDCHYAIGEPSSSIYICEGFATGATIFEAVGGMVVIAFDCGNLKPAAESIRKKYPDARIVVCADNDAFRADGNIGIEKGKEAAAAIGADFVAPEFASTDGHPTDFNDSHQREGLEVVRMQIDGVVKTDSADRVKKVWTKPVFKEITDINRIVKVLANLPPLEYEQYREPISKKFSVRVSVLDQEIGGDRQQGDDKAIQGRAIELYEPEPWPEPIKACDALDGVLKIIQRHMFMTEAESYACVLWIAHAHMFDAFSHTPRLLITAADFGCGKTLLLAHIVGDMIPRPLSCETITPAPFFRMAELHKPAFLIDEVDVFITQDSDLLAGVNNGWEPHGGAIRCVGDDNEPRIFSTHTPMAMAGINLPNKLPESTFSRSVIVDLERAAEDDIKENDIYDREEHRADALIAGRKLARWIADNRDRIKAKQPNLPPKVRNRTADKWKPLFKIAMVAGGDWPERAKKALFGQPDLSEPCKALQLLIDSASVFKGSEHAIHTSDLIERLVDIDDSLWKDYNFRQREDNRRWITTRQIAGLLKRYKIKSCQIRIGAINKNGYQRAPIEKALERYATPLNMVVQPIPDSTALQATGDAGSSDFRPLQKNNSCRGKKAPQATDHKGCRVVDDAQGGGIDVEHRDIGAI